MSQIILNSAENSALIQTLQQSDSKVIPSIYSTKEVYAPSATTWFNQTPTAGQTPAAGSSVTYDLNKYGIAEQMLLTFAISGSFTIPGALAGNHRLVAPAGYIYELIDRIDFLSSSRVISTIYAEDLRAQHTNMSMEALAPVVQTAIGSQFGTAAAAGAASDLTAEYCVPIMFGFMKDINTQPNLSFMEACQVRVTFKRPNYLFLSDANGAILNATGAAGNANVQPVATVPTFSAGAGLTGAQPVLQVRYKQYGEADTAQLLAENYNAEQLNMLTSRCFRENPKSFTLSATAAGTDFQQKVSIDLRNVDVVKSYYVFVTRDVTGQPPLEVFNTVAGQRSVQQCFEIDSVKLTASGQEICTINRTQNLYARLTENGHSFNAVAPGVPLSNTEGSSISALNLQNVYKIQTGLWENDGGGAWSNGWSMREMTNMQIEVTLPLAVGPGATGVQSYPLRGRMETQAAGSETKYTLHVVEDCSTILSTASNTGRTVNSLTN